MIRHKLQEIDMHPSVQLFDFKKPYPGSTNVEVDAFVTPPKDIIGILKFCFTSKVDKYVLDIRNES